MQPALLAIGGEHEPVGTVLLDELDLVDADSGGAGDQPTATMPIAADTWTMGESDIDSDVLEAYLASRRRNA